MSTIVAECAERLRGGEGRRPRSKPDALLLDVQMPKLDGFDVLELIGADVPVVFVTAHDEFAIRAFEVHAVDYLLKPVSRGAPADGAGSRARRVAARRRRGAARVRASARPPGAPLERVVIRDGAQVHVVPVDRIDYVEAQDDYVGFRTGGQAAAERADAWRRRGAARSAPVRAHSPVVRAERGAPRAGGAVRQGQPRGDPRGRHETPGQPVGVSATAAVARRQIGQRAKGRGQREVRGERAEVRTAHGAGCSIKE